LPSEIREREIAEPSAFETFDRLGYVVIPALLEPALVNFFWSYANTKFASQLMTPSSPAVPNSPVSYGDPAFDGLLEHVRPLIEKYSNLRLLPTFSEFRMYKHGDLLKRHRDRLACEISVSVNIGQTPDDSWPLYVEGTAGASSCGAQTRRWAALSRRRLLPLARTIRGKQTRTSISVLRGSRRSLGQPKV